MKPLLMTLKMKLEKIKNDQEDSTEKENYCCMI
jgi:hypothetical protein